MSTEHCSDFFDAFLKNLRGTSADAETDGDRFVKGGSPRSWSKKIPVLKEVIKYKYYSPECACGGGTPLGSIRGVTMYENHRSIDCVTYPRKKPMPYISSYYFNFLKMFESVIDDNSNYNEKILKLLQTWRKCSYIYSSDICSGTEVFMHYAASESATIILNSEWNKIANINDFSRVFKLILNNLEYINSPIEAIKSCYFLLSLIKNPWDHHYLPELYQGKASKKQVSDFFQFEKSNIFVKRIRLLCMNDCEDFVLNLSSLTMNMKNFELKSRYYDEEDDFEFIRDIYYACLARSRKEEELFNHLKCFSPKSDGKFLLQRYKLRIQHLTTVYKKGSLPNICVFLIFIFDMAAFVLIITSLQDPNFNDDFAELLTKWIDVMITLMEFDLKTYSYLKLKETIHWFAKFATKSEHLYLLIDILDEKFGSKLPITLYIELYTLALVKNNKEKQRCKSSHDKEGVFDSLKRFVRGLLKLANLLADILSVCRECVLTAYSLMPSKDLMSRVKHLALLSGKNVTDNSKNSSNFKTIKESAVNVNSVDPQKYGRRHKVKIYKSDEEELEIPIGTSLQNTYHNLHSDLNKLPEPLSRDIIDSLISVIKAPRHNELNWNLEWSEMKILCEQYLNNLDQIIERNMLQRSDLKFIDIDKDSLNDNIQKSMKEFTNGKGYFSSDKSSDEDDTESEASFNNNLKLRLKKLKARPRYRRFGFRRRSINPRKKACIKPQKNVCSLSNNETELKNRCIQTKRKSVEVKDRKPCKKSKPQQQTTREKRTVHKNQDNDFDYSWRSRRK